jgi:phosphatidyl-myo-inositol dimannoside synthase
MERLNQKILESLSVERDVSLVGPAGCEPFAGDATHATGTSIKPLGWFLGASAVKALVRAILSRPGIVFAGSGLAAPIARLCAWCVGARAVVYLHGLDIVVPSRLYQRVWLPFIRRCDLVIVNSRHTAGLAEQAGVRPERIRVVNPGAALPPSDEGALARFRARHGLGEGPILLSVGRFTRRKGLAEFVERALPEIARRQPGVKLAIVGDEAGDALHGARGAERRRIESAAEAASVAAQVVFLGRLDDEALSDAYFAADAHVFPVLDVPGDVEGFGMVALESAAHGLRSIAFGLGGIPDAIAEPQSGFLVCPGDYPAFCERVLASIQGSRDAQAREAARGFASSRDWNHFGIALRAALGAVR